MSSDLELFCKAMDSEWEVINVSQDGKRLHVTYRSLVAPTVTWTHQPFHPETAPQVGDRGRIGFVSSPKRYPE